MKRHLISKLRATEEDTLPPNLGLGRDKGLGLPLDIQSFFGVGGRKGIFIFHKGMKTVLCGNELDSRLLQTYLSSTLKTLLVVS